MVHFRSVLGTIAILASAVLPTVAAHDMFLSVPGFKKTSVSATAPKSGSMDILAWSWGASQSSSTHIGGGGGAGKATFQDLSFTKYTDANSPLFLSNLANGKILQNVTLSVYSTGAPGRLYTQIALSEVLVTSQSFGGSTGEDALTENLTLNFAKFTQSFYSYAKTGVPSQSAFTWNIASNSATR